MKGEFRGENHHSADTAGQLRRRWRSSRAPARPRSRAWPSRSRPFRSRSFRPRPQARPASPHVSPGRRSAIGRGGPHPMRVQVLVVCDDGLVCGLDPVGGRLDVDGPRLLRLQTVGPSRVLVKRAAVPPAHLLVGSRIRQDSFTRLPKSSRGDSILEWSDPGAVRSESGPVRDRFTLTAPAPTPAHLPSSGKQDKPPVSMNERTYHRRMEPRDRSPSGSSPSQPRTTMEPEVGPEVGPREGARWTSST